MKRHFFFENLHSILSFAILGTFVSNLTVGILLFVTGRIGLSVRLSIAECLTFGALISTTNPVSTLTIFQELPVDPTLLYVVFGESVLNDAVSIVLFTTFSKFIGYTYTLSSSIFALLDFGLIFVGSTFVGILFGLLLALLFKHFDFKNCSRIFHSLAHLTETIVFLNLELMLFSLTSGYHAGLIVCIMLFCFLGCAAHVYPISRFLNKRLAEPLLINHQHVLWFSGLRGTVAYALAASFPGEHREDIVAMTMVIVLLTVFCMGGGTISMLERLQIARLTPEQELALDKSVRPVDRMKLL
uniref:Cation/H+ exchanger transmembrane domain-containing protein n=1 Tax=Globisporangium ultimum (strain ATCC 200006 / CBS 805.95 / DAOM BR144) TaxID=431595 RepID=K3WN23_GLOUD